jgi:hypothetical protein
MKTALLAVFALSIAPVFAQAGPPQQPLTPKESMASLKLDKLIADEGKLTAEAQLAQVNYKEMMDRFQSEYGLDQRQIDELSETVRKENGWGPNNVIDRNPQSATFGKWVQAPAPPTPPPPPEKKRDLPAKKK